MCARGQRAAVLQGPGAAPLRQALFVVEAGTALHLIRSKAFFRTVSHTSHQWLSPTAAALVEALLVARVASLPALREQWQQQPRWLLPQILPWYVASHTGFRVDNLHSLRPIPCHVLPPLLSVSVLLTSRMNTGTLSCTATSSSAPGRPRSMRALRYRCVGICRTFLS